MYLLHKIFKTFLNRLRTIYYKSIFKKTGKYLKVFGRVTIEGKNIKIGSHVTLNDNVFLNGRGDLVIGNYCHISPSVQIHTAGLKLDQSYETREHYSGSVYIEEGVWLCSGVIVNPGVRIKKGSVVLPNSVVNKEIEAYELWGGVPAKFIRKLKPA